MAIGSYRDLDAWRLGIELALLCDEVTRTFPREERFGLTSQIRRAAVSIPANIAGGHGRETTGDFIRGLRIAQGSLKELETHVFLAERSGFLGTTDHGRGMEWCDRSGRVIRGLMRRLQERAA